MEAFKPRFKLVVDLETSGSCPIKNGIIAACFLVIDENNNVVDKFSRYVRPPDFNRKNWSLEAQGIHGMTFEQVEKYMSNDQFCYELLCFLAPYKGLMPFDLIIHASRNGWWCPIKKDWNIYPLFDYHFLEWAFRKAKFSNGLEMVWSMFKVIRQDHVISTVQMARDAGYKKNRLNEWAERLGFYLDHHNVESDTFGLLKVYKYLIAREVNNGF